ncbi:MAG: ATP-dependent Clp protease ATP-binding subunit [Candidatus Liptonbacteria bacterium]|nr:ATP-dependent Clp protease ATP-binding subunit [Candidatus Liptonbacteria bacterium]
MDSAAFKDKTLLFDDPRLHLSGVGRFVVRVLSYTFLLFLTGAAITLALSDIRGLQVLGVLLLLFLLDRAWHAGRGDRSIRDLRNQDPVNLAKCVSSRTFGILERAFERSGIKHSNVLLEVFQDLLHLPEVVTGFERLEISLEEFRTRLQATLKESSTDSHAERLKKLEELVVGAFEHAGRMHHSFIEPADVFAAFPFLSDPAVAKLLNIFSLKAADMEGVILFGELSRKLARLSPSSLGSFGKLMRPGVRHRIMNRAWTARPTPMLDSYSTDFTDLARAGAAGFLVGHKAELERLLDVLARPLNPNALLVGEAGAGKETLVAHFAALLIKDEVPSALFDKRLVGLDIAELVAGAAPEELHARLQRIVGEIIEAGNIILYLPDIHNFLKTSSSAYISVADALVPILRNNAFSVIGATYPREFAASIEPRSDLTGIFEVIRVEEISESEATTILVYDAMILEGQFKVRTTLGAIKNAVTLAKKYLREKLLPTSAEELLKSALALASKRGDKVLRKEDVIKAVEARVNVPVHEATKEEAEKLLNLEKIIHERMVDQEEAVKAVADALRAYRSGLARKGGPIATFLFVGPTGVGKTELAKTLARVEFGSENAMVRFDMTEYQEVASLRRFIGATDGSVGGTLTRAVTEKPYCVVLLDEFEKANPDILDLFLQLLDDGRLTDAIGRTVSFENTIIIATSNAHSDLINTALRQGQPMMEIAEYLKSRLTDVFRPELVNRFSKIVVFKNLSPDDLRKIAGLQLKELGKTLEEQGIALEADASAIDLLVKLGYEPQFGARPLRRVIEEKIRAPLSEEILKGNASRGTTLTVRGEGDAFRFEVKS